MNLSRLTCAALFALAGPLYAQQPVTVFKGHDGPVNSIDVSPDGKLLISGSKDETIRVWDIQEGKPDKTIATRGSSVKEVMFSTKGDRFAAALYERVAEFDTRKLKGKASKRLHTAFVETCVYSPDDRFILTSSWRDRTLVLVHAGSLKKHREFADTTWIDQAIFSNDGKRVYAGGHDNKIKCWDIESGELMRSMSAHDDWVYDLCFSPDGKTLYSASFDKTVRVWDVSTGKNTSTLRGHTEGVVAIDVSPAGNYIASAGADMHLIIWDAASGKEVTKFKAHDGTIMDVKFSPDGKLIYTCSFDKTIKAWEVPVMKLSD
jgi:WD40 repeat protein